MQVLLWILFATTFCSFVGVLFCVLYDLSKVDLL